MRIGFLIGGVALAVAIIGAISFLSQDDADVVEPLPAPVAEPAPTPRTPPAARPAPASVPAPPPEPVVTLPELAASDDFVRAETAAFALPLPWLERDNLLQRLAVVVENASRGEYPRRQLTFLAPDGRFGVIERGGAFYLDPVNYERFDSYVALLEGVPPPELGAFLELVMPLLDQAIGELGIAGARDPLLAAIDQVLAAPVRRGDIELIQPKVFYEFAEPRLEALPPLHKQMLRLGPANTERVQAYLRQLRGELAP